MSVLLAVGCRQDERGDAFVDEATFQKACAEAPGCAEPRFSSSGSRETIWRVMVSRQVSGGVRIAAVEVVEVPEGDGVPVSPLGGSHRLVGLDEAGRVVDGQRLRFPEIARVEFPAGRAKEEIDLSGREVGAVGYLRALPAIVSIAVQGADGETVASAPAPRERAAADSGVGTRAAGFLPLAVGSDDEAWPYQHNLPPYCAHVRLLEGEDDWALAAGFQDVLEGIDPGLAEEEMVEIVVPGPTQRAVLYGALGRMTPLLCQSVALVAFVAIPESSSLAGAVGWQMGDLLLLNATMYSEAALSTDESMRHDLLRVAAHEAGHCAYTLLNTQASDPDFGGDWELEPRTLASRTIDRVRVEKGLWREWQRMHGSFRAVGWAGGYADRDVSEEWSSGQIVEAGFLSGYGAQDIPEDISELIGWTYLRGSEPEIDLSEWGSVQDWGCQEMREQESDGVPSRLAALYTKLMFLQDLGLVAEEDVEECAGPRLGLPDDASGFHFWRDGDRLRSFTTNVTASIGTQPDGDRIFQMQGEGEAAFGDGTYPAEVRLQLHLAGPDEPLHRVSWPRGVYVLGLLGDNKVLLRLEEARSGNFDVKDGYALVAESSSDRIAGSIFATQAMRLSAPLPVPQTWDPPLVIRFRIEH